LRNSNNRNRGQAPPDHEWCLELVLKKRSFELFECFLLRRTPNKAGSLPQHIHFHLISYHFVFRFFISLFFYGALGHSIALPLLYGTPCQNNFDNTACFSSFHLLNFTRNLKPHIFVASFPTFLRLPLLWLFSLTLCLSSIVIFICHSLSPHSLNFILWTNL
jgi:hypothetical protein